ncbi:MAG: hypothetical protein LBJ46_08640 [Planctomycetota bacterium]|jgi:hypothetical protein|nr:hypothetical protein [Planctomycetota bacterium]
MIKSTFLVLLLAMVGMGLTDASQAMEQRGDKKVMTEHHGRSGHGGGHRGRWRR